MSCDGERAEGVELNADGSGEGVDSRVCGGEGVAGAAEECGGGVCCGEGDCAEEAGDDGGALQRGDGEADRDALRGDGGRRGDLEGIDGRDAGAGEGG